MFLKQVDYSENPFWKYLLGSFVIIIFSVIGQLPLNYVVIEAGHAAPGNDPMEILRNLDLDKNLQLFLLLIPFASGFLGFWFVIRKLNKRSFLSVTTSRPKIDWSRVLYAFLLWGSVSVMLIIGDYFISPESYEWNFNFKSFSLLFIIAVALIPIQTTLEEYIFRGYLMQGFAGMFKNRWAPLLMSSIVFGSLHLFNPEVEKLGYGIMIYYVGTGLFLGILTLMDEGIELAIGFHAANNLFTALLVTSSWTAFQTESILIDISEPSLGIELVLSLVVLYPLFLFIMSNKYAWSQWKSKLTSKI